MNAEEATDAAMAYTRFLYSGSTDMGVVIDRTMDLLTQQRIWNATWKRDTTWHTHWGVALSDYIER